MTEKVISIEQSFDKVTFHITGEDNFLNTVKVELDVYELAQLILKSKNKIDMKKENKPKFILQQKLPDGSEVGDEYVYMGDSCLVYKNNSRPMKMKIPFTSVENNKSWFKIKEEVKPTVVEWFNDGKPIDGKGLDGISFEINILPKSIYISKERLAEILIAESKDNLVIGNQIICGMEEVIDGYKTGRRLYTEKEYLQFGEDCFHAARNYKNVRCDGIINSTYEKLDFKTFSDYMNDKNKI